MIRFVELRTLLRLITKARSNAIYLRVEFIILVSRFIGKLKYCKCREKVAENCLKHICLLYIAVNKSKSEANDEILGANFLKLYVYCDARGATKNPGELCELRPPRYVCFGYHGLLNALSYCVICLINRLAILRIFMYFSLVRASRPGV